MWAPVKACWKATVQHVGTGNFSLRQQDIVSAYINIYSVYIIMEY